VPIYIPEEKTFELCPAGTHTGVCRIIADLGTQSGQYGQKRQLQIIWELPDERMADGRLFSIGRRYNYSSDRKSNLRADLEGWLGRVLTADDFGRFDLGRLLGATATLGVKHNLHSDGRTFANIVSVMRPGKGVPPRLPLVNGGVVFSLSDQPFAYSDFEALPQWLQDTIRKSLEYQAATQTRQTGTNAQRLAAVMAASTPTAAIEDPPFNDQIPL
jgi:hypothetical protein